MRAWRNMKISIKLLSGFGTLLLIFAVSVFVMRQYVGIVQQNTETQVNGVVPSLEMSAALNTEGYELFMAALNLEYKETPANAAAYRERLASYTKAQDALLALHKERPELKAPEYVSRAVAPAAKQYAGIMDNILTLLTKKDALFQAFRKDGQDASAAVDVMLTELHAYMNQRIGSGASPAQLSSLSDAMKTGAKLLENAMGTRRDVWRAVFDGDVNAMGAILNNVHAMRGQAEELRPFLVSAGKEAAMERLLASFASYETNVNGFIETFREVFRLYESLGPVTVSFNGEISTAMSTAAARIKEISDLTLENLGQAVFIMIISTAAAILLGLLVAFLISRSISRPLKTIVGLAERAGKGDLTIERKDFGYEGRDEMGTLVLAISDMIDAQEETMREVVGVAHSLSEGAGNLSAISEESNASMEEVKAAVEQVANLSEGNGAALQECNAGVEEVSAGADTSARSATDGAASIAHTADVSNSAGSKVNEVITGMRKVSANSAESEEKMRHLVASVDNVSGFVSVITGIADQTNLLALNAAIEAARAGEVGRGFAVVAEEVRKLAEESGSAAQSVNSIIKELQDSAHENIEAAMESGRMLTKTLESAEDAQSALSEALKEMNGANDAIQNIAAVSEEQAASSKEVATAIDSATASTMEIVTNLSSIRRACDETAQAAEGVAEQAEEMSQHAQTLTEVLSRFKLREAGIVKA